ncbi:MAG TPA: hypothetical protein DCY13_07255, partial [Verrucomicrobiales bacterium]|nr:hypothetical protein [Verrucomicrobiales bacterium]
DPAHLLDPGLLRRQNAAEIFLRLLGDYDSDLRQAAAEALGRIGDPKAIPPLVKAMHDSSRWVGRASAGALQALHWTPESDNDRRLHESLLGR